MNKASICMFRVQWFLTPLERHSIPRWSLFWGPIIIGNPILQFLFGITPMMKTSGLLDLVDFVFPSICFARSFITLPDPLSPCCALHSLILHFCTLHHFHPYIAVNKLRIKNIRLVING